MANKSHTENTESTEIEPSQMAFYMGSPEGEKLYKIIFKIEQNRRGHHRWRIKVTRKSRKAQKLSHHRWQGYGDRLEARNSCVPPVASGKAERYKNLIQNYSKVLQDRGFFLKKAA